MQSWLRCPPFKITINELWSLFLSFFSFLSLFLFLLKLANCLVPGPLALDLSGGIFHSQLICHFLVFFFLLLPFSFFAFKPALIVFLNQLIKAVMLILSSLLLIVYFLLLFVKSLHFLFSELVTICVYLLQLRLLYIQMRDNCLVNLVFGFQLLSQVFDLILQLSLKTKVLSIFTRLLSFILALQVLDRELVLNFCLIDFLFELCNLRIKFLGIFCNLFLFLFVLVCQLFDQNFLRSLLFLELHKKGAVSEFFFNICVVLIVGQIYIQFLDDFVGPSNQSLFVLFYVFLVTVHVRFVLQLVAQLNRL